MKINIKCKCLSSFIWKQHSCNLKGRNNFNWFNSFSAEIPKCQFHAFWKILMPYSMPHGISCYWMDIDGILANSHSIFLDRYWSRIAKFPFHVFYRYWFHIQDIGNTLHESPRLFGPRLFQDYGNCRKVLGNL